MKIGLIDVDGHNFPNLPLMKLSTYHKRNGDTVEWYNPLMAWKYPYDKAYMSKVFTFTLDYPHPINAKEIIRGGTGYFYPDGGQTLPPEIEHIYPDYSLYSEWTKDTAYGFLTRGCPRGCEFCIVGDKEGHRSRKVADLSEFWHDQKNIELLDPNMFSCPDWKDTICKYLSCENNSEITRLSQDNDGWIPVNERLPENERSVLMCGDTGCIDVGWWNGKRWKTGFSHADNFEAVAWRPLPNPYRPASKTPEEMQEWKERMLRNFLRGHKTIRG